METLLHEIIKSINSEANNKSPGNDDVTAEFYKHFSNEQAPFLLDVHDFWGSLAPWGLYLKQEAYRSNIKKVKEKKTKNI